MVPSILRSDFCLGFLRKCTLLAQHWWCAWRYIYPSFSNGFWTVSQFQSNLTEDFRSQYIKIYEFFEKRLLGEEKERGSITALIEKKAEAGGQFFTDITESTWRRGMMLWMTHILKKHQRELSPYETAENLNTRKAGLHYLHCSQLLFRVTYPTVLSLYHVYLYDLDLAQKISGNFILEKYS